MFCFIDFETTGLDRDRHAIITGCFGVKKDLKSEFFEHMFAFRMKPSGFEIDPKAMEVNKITDEMLDKFGEREDVIKDIEDWIKQFPILTPVGHNVSFDLGFLNKQLPSISKNFHFRFLDTMVIARFLRERNEHDFNGYSLAMVAEYFGITYDAHDAVEDVKTTAEVLRRML